MKHILIAYSFLSISLFANSETSNQILPKLKTNISEDFYTPLYTKNYSIKGKAIFEFTVCKDGSVDEIEIIKYPYGQYNQLLIDSVSRLKFTPGTVNGLPIDVRYRLPITFEN